MPIAPVYRVQCSGPCRRWLSLPDGYQPGTDLPLAALVPQPTAERAGLWPDETAARYAAFAAGWSGGTCPDCAAARPDAAPETEAHPVRNRWAVETRDPGADEWVPGHRFLNRHHAVERLAALTENHPVWYDGTPAQRRLVRETTTHTVEQPAAAARPDNTTKEA